jgi:hypothetical protein
MSGVQTKRFVVIGALSLKSTSQSTELQSVAACLTFISLEDFVCEERDGADQNPVYVAACQLRDQPRPKQKKTCT